jgi:hypothetical protein
MRFWAVAAVALLAASCSDPEAARLKATTKPVYDARTGNLIELTYDRNKNGVIDTWTTMDGRCPVSSVTDTNEDGVIDRWEIYDHCGQLVKVGLLRAKPDLVSKVSKPDEWVYMGPDGKPNRVEFIEVSNVTGVEGVVRREFYDGDVLVRAEEDTDGDGLMDRWEGYVNKQLRTVDLDTGQNGKPPYDGKPKMRYTYDANGALVLIESQPDATGAYTKRVVPGKK